jgi:capsular polysaccharide biosynthesis protein
MSLQRISQPQQAQLRINEAAEVLEPPGGSAQAFAGDDSPIFRMDLKRSLQSHGKLVWTFVILGVAGALVLGARKWPVYIAQSQIYVQPVSPHVLEQSYQPSWPFDSNTYDSFVQQQVQSASNPTVLLNAVHKMGGAWQASGEDEQAAAGRLGAAIKAERIGTSYEMQITARTKDPARSAQAANAVAASIVDWATGEANAGNTQRVAILREERDRVQKELDGDRAEQGQLNMQLGMAAVGATSPDLIDNAIEKTREELIKAQTEHDEAAARFNVMTAGPESAGALGAQADAMVATDSGLNSMKQWLYQRRAQLITQMANLTPNNPSYKQDAEELAQTNSSLDSMTTDLRTQASTRIQEGLRADLKRTAEVESRLNGELRQMVGTAATASPKLQRASDLAANIARLQTRYATVDEQIQNLSLQNIVPGALHISVPAVAPGFPSIMDVVKPTLPIALAGILLGLMAALIASNLDPRIYLASEVEQVLGVAPMAVIPDFRFISDETANEFMLRIAAPIEQGCKQGTLKSCVFTGAGPGAGASTVARHVRDLLEAMGRPAVLVDSSTVEVDPSAMPHAVKGGFGRRGPKSEQASAQLQKADAAARNPECVVLNDAEPLVSSAEAEYLARYVDCTIVVIESGVTTREQLRTAAKALQRLRVPSAGFVLNRVNVAKADQAYKDVVQEAEQNVRRRGRVRVRQMEPTWREAVAEEMTPSPAPEGMPQMAAPLQAAQPYVPVPPPIPYSPPVAAPFRPGYPAEQQRMPLAAPVPSPFDSRLSGLRGMEFEQGLRTMSQTADPVAREQFREPIPQPVPQPRPEPPAPKRPEAREAPPPPPTPPPQPEPRAAETVPTVTTVPEFLPPKLKGLSKGQGRGWENDDLVRRDRGSPYDDDDGILPSWRGQYK